MMAKFESDFSRKFTGLVFYKDVSTLAEQRDAARKVMKEEEDFMTAIWMRADFYEAIKQYKERAERLGAF